MTAHRLFVKTKKKKTKNLISQIATVITRAVNKSLIQPLSHRNLTGIRYQP